MATTRQERLADTAARNRRGCTVKNGLEKKNRQISLLLLDQVAKVRIIPTWFETS